MGILGLIDFFAPRLAVEPARLRIDDAVSNVNADIHDDAKLLARAVALVDHLGLHIIQIKANRDRNKQIIVRAGPECDGLGGVEIAHTSAWTVFTINRFGVEIRWVVYGRAAAPVPSPEGRRV